MPTSILTADGRSLTLDLVGREAYNPSLAVTSHPIEDGAQVADHVQKLPLPIVLEGLVTESPFEGRERDLPTGEARSLAVLDFLRSIEGEHVSIVSAKLGTFENMVLTRYPHEITNLAALPLTLEFVEVRVAQSQTVQIPPEQPAPAVAHAFADEAEAGEQPTGEANDSEQLGSWAVLNGDASGLTSFFGLGGS